MYCVMPVGLILVEVLVARYDNISPQTPLCSDSSKLSTSNGHKKAQ